ncbi:MAG: ABC transporter permease [Lachnospiraceae bacterium]|nr:ABC transporter permease [Lachnospiraceae bacterium]
MDNYRTLAVRYLKINKRRSIVTIMGVAVAVTVLYMILNLGWSAVLNKREKIREENDYELVLFTENQNQIEQIMADDKVKNASVGQYYDYDYYEPKTYPNALYINTQKPYHMERILENLCSTYGVEGETNYELSIMYFQVGNGEPMVIILLVVPLISFIFAIFGVGIIRNSIQMSILEQIKDYGNLRCVGASRGQLKTIVYMEGAILEIIGMFLGILIGTLGSVIIGYFVKWNAEFHFLPVIPIVIAFLGDLFFAMEENCKVIVNLTPVSAIRGEYRIRKEKIKARKQSVFGKILGIEGDYAYKSIMRNPGRFHKTVWALGIGIAMYIAIAGIGTSVSSIIRDEQERCKYFHVYFENILEPTVTADEVKSHLPSTEVLKQISDLKEVEEAKRIYSAEVILADVDSYYKYFTEEYKTQTVMGGMLAYQYQALKDGIIKAGFHSLKVPAYGYDEEDYARYQTALTDGTLDVSKNGIVLVNHGKVAKSETESAAEIELMDVQYTDYKVGDTIDIVDMAKCRPIILERIEKLTVEYEAEKKRLSDLPDEDGSIAKELSAMEGEYWDARCQAVEECREQMVRDGFYKTYTIEGIVNDDVNRESYLGSPCFVLPLEQYYALTGTDESMVTGMQYHFNKFPVEKFGRIIPFEWDDFYLECSTSAYPTFMYAMQTIRYWLLGFLLFIIFIVMMTTFNIINTTAGNLHLRRKEFAQLRVLGISKKRLMNMVLLEGVITMVVANVLGIIIGGGLSFAIFRGIITTLFGYTYRFPFVAALFGFLISAGILCGSIYVPLKGMKQDMAADLSIGGD